MSTQTADRCAGRKPISARKLAANRLNARRSTGPLTKEGKRRSSRNATTHGLFTDFCLIPGENAADYLTFRHGILTSLHPTDPAQLMLADKIVSAQWRLKRLRLAERSLYAARTVELREVAEEQGEEQGATPGEIECFDEDWRERTGQTLLPERDRYPDFDPALPAELLLLSFISADDQAHKPFDRLCRYEQRLELTLHRCLRDYRQLKKEQWEYAADDLPAFIPPLPAIPARTEEHDAQQDQQREQDDAPAPTPDIEPRDEPSDERSEAPDPSPPNTKPRCVEPPKADKLNPVAPHSARKCPNLSDPIAPGKNEPTESNPHLGPSDHQASPRPPPRPQR